MPNIPLMRKVMEYIATNPEELISEEWGQRSDCGSAYCFAGHTVRLSGYEFVWFENYAGVERVIGVRSVYPPAIGESPSLVAQELLEITPEEAETLFYWNNSLEDLWEIVGNISGGEISYGAFYDPPVCSVRQGAHS